MILDLFFSFFPFCGFFSSLFLAQADDSTSVRHQNVSLLKAAVSSSPTDPEDIQGQSLWFRQPCLLTKIIQYDTYNMRLYLHACVSYVCVCVTSLLSSRLPRSPRGLPGLKTIFVPETSVSGDPPPSHCT